MVRKFSFDDLKAVGDFLFTDDESSLVVILPDQPAVPVALSVSRTPKPHHWNLTGDLACPSLTPSIQIMQPGNWHGYITNGQLHAC